MPPAITVEAPCKINLHLRVKGRRADGFHELESVFLALGFGDTLHFALGDAGMGDELLVEDGRPQPGGPLEELPQGDNIILKAARLFRARTGFDRPLRIRLEKRIPLGAGLGGGSSDGASTLLALNGLARRLGQGGMGPAGLRDAAAELGSDVPFFLGDGAWTGAAYVTGRGERILPIDGPPQCTVLLANPGFPSNTGEAFRLLDAYRESSIKEGFGADPEGQELIKALKGPPSQWPYKNDFLEVFLAGGGRDGDAYRAILEGLRAGGADFCGLTGSGSTCFGIFTEGGAAERAEKTLRTSKSVSMSGVFTVLTFPLARFANAGLE